MAVRCVFLIGPPRTGTTLLTYLLAGGEATSGLSEPFLAHSIMQPWVLHRYLYSFQVQAGPERFRVPWHCSRERFFSFFKQVAEGNRIRTLVIKETFRDGEMPDAWRDLDRARHLDDVRAHPSAVEIVFERRRVGRSDPQPFQLGRLRQPRRRRDRDRQPAP